MATEPVYFKSATALRQWFAGNASTASELVIGFIKTTNAASGIT